MFKWFKQETDDRGDAFIEIMKPGSIAVLSASCCAPNTIAADEVLMERLRSACAARGIDAERIQVQTVTAAQQVIPEISSRLDDRQKALVDKLTTLFMTNGLGVFPMLIVDGELAFYGGAPEISDIEDKLASLAA